mmetsp:Transcript_7294/g.17559  ORF Transcript_7294/g.17559 Transcript_7294/m.17559 type:complete len:203 (-) Transcript_7294:845-1453(-)
MPLLHPTGPRPRHGYQQPKQSDDPRAWGLCWGSLDLREPDLGVRAWSGVRLYRRIKRPVLAADDRRVRSGAEQRRSRGRRRSRRVFPPVHIERRADGGHLRAAFSAALSGSRNVRGREGIARINQLGEQRQGGISAWSARAHGLSRARANRVRRGGVSVEGQRKGGLGLAENKQPQPSGTQRRAGSSSRVISGRSVSGRVHT